MRCEQTTNLLLQIVTGLKKRNRHESVDQDLGACCGVDGTCWGRSGDGRSIGGGAARAPTGAATNEPPLSPLRPFSKCLLCWLIWRSQPISLFLRHSFISARTAISRRPSDYSEEEKNDWRAFFCIYPTTNVLSVCMYVSISLCV